MSEELTTKNFPAKFENLDIYIHSIDVEKVKDGNNELFPYNTPFTGMWHNTNVHTYLPDRKEIVGKIFLMLKDQTESSNTALWVGTQFRIMAESDTPSNMIAKFIQYLFEWVASFVKRNDIKNESGNEFIIPGFLYSRHHFETEFPD